MALQRFECGGEREVGTLEAWTRDYGFLRHDGESRPSVFIHRSAWPLNLPIRLGARVSFVAEDTGRGPRAAEVRSLEGGGVADSDTAGASDEGRSSSHGWERARPREGRAGRR